MAVDVGLVFKKESPVIYYTSRQLTAKNVWTSKLTMSYSETKIFNNKEELNSEKTTFRK
jgi:hypothetical protein